MKLTKNLSAAAVCLLLASGALSSQAQQTWQATLGAQSKDMGTQAIAFLPNELWIHVGDSIMWTSQSGDIHTVSFLMTGQPLTDFTTGCPGFAMSPATFDGIHCISAPPLVQGQTFTVKFNAVGNFPLVCLVHPHMTGVIHVLAKSATLPHDQGFYTKEAADQTKQLLADTDGTTGHGNMGNMGGNGQNGMGDMNDEWSASVTPGKAQVAAGWGEMNGNGAGFQSTSVVRFLNGTIKVHAGDTVEWTVKDPALPHTVTFGPDPDNPGPPSSNVTMDADGALHVTLHFVGETATSGILGAAPMNQPNVPVSPPGVTRFRVTFVHAGTYNYQCALHDDLGMLGKVIVLP
jgi:plastocyanin